MPSAIRPARPDEADALKTLVEAAYARWVPVVGARPLPMDDDYAARVAAGQAFLLEGAGTIAGLVVLEECDGFLLLDNVALAHGFEGQGLGRTLIAFAEAEAARRGFAELRLYTNARMERNIRLYERLGFAETHREERRPGFVRVWMRKPLPAAA
jgi:ribosomal protein S18 acetylase RimI-like enzyme